MSVTIEAKSGSETNVADALRIADSLQQEAARLGVALRLYPEQTRFSDYAGIRLAVVPADVREAKMSLEAEVETFRTLEASWNERTLEPDLTVRLDYVWNPEAGA